MGKYENISIGVTLEQIKLIYPELDLTQSFPRIPKYFPLTFFSLYL